MNIRRHLSIVLFANTSCTRAFTSQGSQSSIQYLNSSLSLSTTPNSISTMSNNDLDQAKQRISQAISQGAPAYNAGDIKQCATIYKQTARDIATLVPSTFQSKLLQEVDDDNDTTNATEDHDAKAWALRRVFDSIIDYQLPLMPQAIALEDNIKYEPFTATEPIQVMDSVMGGRSTGSFVSKSNLFFGETSLANNGGFSSIRWRFSNIQNWSYAKGIYIRGLKHSKAEEHTFRLILKDAMCERVRIANYKVVFANPQQLDEPLLIPFSETGQMEQMGRTMQGSPNFNPSAVTEIGLMAIKPTVVGEFMMEFEEWGLYS